MNILRVQLVIVVAFLSPLYTSAQALNPLVSQENIRITICKPGWSATIRPPISYTAMIKRALMQASGIPWNRRVEYELDHIVPLELGGAPRDIKNLTLQPWVGPNGARAKDVVETKMHHLVCAGSTSLAYARDCMVSDWRACKV